MNKKAMARSKHNGIPSNIVSPIPSIINTKKREDIGNKMLVLNLKINSIKRTYSAYDKENVTIKKRTLPFSIKAIPTY